MEQLRPKISEWYMPPISCVLFVKKRLTYKNADLCNALAATQCSRNILERDIIVLKRTRLEERSKGASSTHFLEIKDLLMQNERLKKALDHKQLEMVSVWDGRERRDLKESEVGKGVGRE